MSTKQTYGSPEDAAVGNKFTSNKLGLRGDISGIGGNGWIGWGMEYGIEHLALQCSGKGMVDIYRHKGVRSYLAHCRNSMKENIYFRNICR